MKRKAISTALQERSAIIGRKTTTGGVADIAARLAEMLLHMKQASVFVGLLWDPSGNDPWSLISMAMASSSEVPRHPSRYSRGWQGVAKCFLGGWQKPVSDVGSTGVAGRCLATLPQKCRLLASGPSRLVIILILIRHAMATYIVSVFCGTASFYLLHLIH